MNHIVTTVKASYLSMIFGILILVILASCNKTGAKAPTAPVGLTDLAVEEGSTTEDSVELTWSRPTGFGTTDGTTAAIFGSYAVKVYQGADESGSEVEGLTLDPSSLDESTVSVKVSGLSSDTQYAFKLELSNKNNPPLSSDSNVVSETTKPGRAPAGLTGLTVTEASTTAESVELTWIQPTDFGMTGGGTEARFGAYVVRVYQGADESGSEVEGVTLDPPSLGESTVSVKVSGLDPLTQYAFQLVLSNGNDPPLSSKSNVVTETTTVDPNTGKTWTQAAAGDRFSERSQHATVVFDNKLWVIGGGQLKTVIVENEQVIRRVAFNDVWSSPDGKSWTEVTEDVETPRFSARLSPAAVVFDNKIWVIGGTDDDDSTKPVNDVWFSEDGKSWTEVPKSATTPRFSGRSNFAAVVFKDKLWVIGGDKENDVWSSPDGKTWTEETKNSSDRFSERSQHATVVFDNKLWVIGGAAEDGTNRRYNDVWSSPDGKVWTEVTKDVTSARFPGRFGHEAMVYDGKIWVTSGFVSQDDSVGNSGYTNDVWSSPDGKSWTEVAAPVTGGTTRFAPRQSFAVEVFRGRLWVISGTTNSLSNSNDVWRSP